MWWTAPLRRLRCQLRVVEETTLREPATGTLTTIGLDPAKTVFQERAMLTNGLRGDLAEFGIITAKGPRGITALTEVNRAGIPGGSIS